MKILMCHKFLFPLGGAERYLLDLREGLARLGHTVIDFSTHNIHNPGSEYSDFFVRGWNFSEILSRRQYYNVKAALNFIYSLEAKDNIERLINKYTPDIAHIHNIYHHISPSILPVLRKNKIPVVMTLHDYKLVCPNYSLFTANLPCERCKSGNYFNTVIHKCLNNSYPASFLGCLEMYFAKIFKLYENNVDLFIAPSVFVKNKFIDFGIDKRKIYYLPYAIDLAGFNPNFDHGKYILYIGNLYAKKGVETLLMSAKYLKGISIKIIGEGPQRCELESFSRRERLTNVEFLGYRSKKDLAGFIRDALFTVVPSRWYEVSGLIIYESFASGKCVVASNIGGLPELVDDGLNGLLFRPGDFNDLVEKIRYLINNPMRIRELGRNAYEKICQINRPEAHCQNLLNTYNQLINNSRQLN
jgi:glycosyltransferase involved in cell wall biosynthesis